MSWEAQPEPTTIGSQVPSLRPSVNARMEHLRALEVHESSAFSAAVLEIDSLIKRRARRQSMVSKLSSRRVTAGNVSWAVRSALSVCASAVLVLNGSIVRHISHGYGIWALITCVNCNEKLQGDLLRKSMERAAGTAIGGFAAMAVLFFDDYFVPEVLGWNARAHFYLMDVGLFTVAGVYLRAINKASPAFDYSYFLAVLSFDFLLLDSFSDANQYLDSMERIFMVSAGGLLTCGIGTTILPQYGGQELTAMSAEAFEGTAALLEVTASSLVMAFSARSHGPSALPPEINLAQAKRLADLSRYEVRLFPPAKSQKGDEANSRLPRLSFQMDWGHFVQACRTAQDVREVCKSAEMIFETGMPSSVSPPANFEVELIVMVEEAAAVLRHCSDHLRSSWKRARRGPGFAMAGHWEVVPPLWEDCDENLVRFEAALQALEQRLGAVHSIPAAEATGGACHQQMDLQLAAVRLLAGRMRDKLLACVDAVKSVEAAGLLETPLAFPSMI